MDANSDRFELGGRGRRAVLSTAGLVGAGLLAGCAGTEDPGPVDGSGGSGGGSGQNGDPTGGSGSNGGDESPDTDGDGGDASWRGMELTDVRTDETFTIAGFDEPVVVQGFAAWCENCKQQSDELAKIKNEVTLVGLNVWPDEDKKQVRNHANENGYDWRFAVAPSEMTKSLKSEFGTTVLHPPSRPVIISCPDGSSTFHTGGISASKARSTAEDC
jgi:thiol-disulfide isomerase/thioredoxin